MKHSNKPYRNRKLGISIAPQQPSHKIVVGLMRIFFSEIEVGFIKTVNNLAEFEADLMNTNF